MSAILRTMAFGWALVNAYQRACCLVAFVAGCAPVVGVFFAREAAGRQEDCRNGPDRLYISCVYRFLRCAIFADSRQGGFLIYRDPDRVISVLPSVAAHPFKCAEGLGLTIQEGGADKGGRFTNEGTLELLMMCAEKSKLSAEDLEALAAFCRSLSGKRRAAA